MLFFGSLISESFMLRVLRKTKSTGLTCCFSLFFLSPGHRRSQLWFKTHFKLVMKVATWKKQTLAHINCKFLAVLLQDAHDTSAIHTQRLMTALASQDVPAGSWPQQWRGHAKGLHTALEFPKLIHLNYKLSNEWVFVEFCLRCWGGFQ